MDPSLFSICVFLVLLVFKTTLFSDDTSLHLSHKNIKMLQLNIQN